MQKENEWKSIMGNKWTKRPISARYVSVSIVYIWKSLINYSGSRNNIMLSATNEEIA